MARKMVVLAMTIILVIGMVVATSFAGMNAGYSTTTMQKIGQKSKAATDNPGKVYGKLVPGATSPTAYLKICNSSGSVVYKTGIYPAYPLNPNNTSDDILPGQVRGLFATPVNSGDYVWGTGTYGMS